MSLRRIETFDTFFLIDYYHRFFRSKKISNFRSSLYLKKFYKYFLIEFFNLLGNGQVKTTKLVQSPEMLLAEC